MSKPSDDIAYRALDAGGVRELLAGLGAVRRRLGAPAEWRIREVGDGNLNLVFIVEGPDGSVCVKQALPYVRVAGPSWPMALDRAFFENSYYRQIAPHVGRRIPTIYHYDPQQFCIVMECLSPHIILRQGLIAGRRYPNLARDMGDYVARATFFSSDLASPFEEKLKRMALFAANQPLIRISVDLIFKDPYVDSERNRHTAPELDATAAEFRRDGALKAAAARYGHKFLTQAEALIHGDLHSGSVMVTNDETRVIDPEFAFYGPIGFDLGAFFGNLLLNWYAQPGHATAADDRRAHQEWILDQAAVFWMTFRSTFLALWSAHPTGDAYPAAMFASAEDAVWIERARIAYVESILADMLGFAACKMIRRLLGFAHVIDFDSIGDRSVRVRCEADALELARLLLTHPQQFREVGDVLDAVPKVRATRVGV